MHILVLYVAPPSLPPPPPSPASSSLCSIVSWWVSVYPVPRPGGRLWVSLFVFPVRLLVVIIAVWTDDCGTVGLAGHIMCGGDGVTGSPALTDTTPPLYHHWLLLGHSQPLSCTGTTLLHSTTLHSTFHPPANTPWKGRCTTSTVNHAEVEKCECKL